MTNKKTLHFSLATAQAVILSSLVSLSPVLVNARSQFGEGCEVRFSDTNFKYFETGLGNQRCDAGLVCITESDNGLAGIDFPGLCEQEKCFGSLSGGGNTEDNNVKVTICHRTCSEVNPWVRITINENAYSDESCKHGQHEVSTCNKDPASWGVNDRDYLLKRHGTRAEVAASLGFANGDITDYWNHWESACPYVRNGACCDFDGEYGYSCCPGPGDPGPEDFTDAPTAPPITAAPVTPSPTPAPISSAPITPNPTLASANPYPVADIATAPPAESPAPREPNNTPAPVTGEAPVQDPAEECRRRKRRLSTLEELWNITEPTFIYDSLSFTLDFGINDLIGDQSQVRATLFDSTCQNPYTGNGLSRTVDALYDPVAADGEQKAPITVLIDSENIAQDSQVYSEDVPPFGQVTAGVDFCMRFSLHTPPSLGEDIEVNFLEVIVALDVDLTDGFQIGNITVAPFDICEFQAEDAFEVEGYFCENGNEPIPIELPVLNQGDLVKVCVRPVERARDLSIRMRNIRNFTFTGADGISQVAVSNFNAAANGLTDLWCDPGYAICHFETILFAAFFARPGLVTGFGFADLQFGGESSDTSVSPKVRRQMRRAAAAYLQSGGEGKQSDTALTTAGSSPASSTRINHNNRGLQDVEGEEADGSTGAFSMEFVVQGEGLRNTSSSSKLMGWTSKILMATAAIASVAAGMF